jgi:RNA polymerase-binding transcription factor DksA
MTDTAATSMPPRDNDAHLTAQQLGKLRGLLEDRLQAHHDRTVHAEATLDAFTSGDSPHERELARDAVDQLLEGVREHRDALARIDAGTYGRCGVCNEPIPFPRLEAIPEATTCVQCVRFV